MQIHRFQKNTQMGINLQTFPYGPTAQRSSAARIVSRQCKIPRLRRTAGFRYSIVEAVAFHHESVKMQGKNRSSSHTPEAGGRFLCWDRTWQRRLLKRDFLSRGRTAIALCAFSPSETRSLTGSSQFSWQYTPMVCGSVETERDSVSMRKKKRLPRVRTQNSSEAV